MSFKNKTKAEPIQDSEGILKVSFWKINVGTRHVYPEKD